MDDETKQKLAEAGMSYMTTHGNRVIQENTAKPGLQELVRKLMEPEPLNAAGEMFAEAYIKYADTGESTITLTKELPGYYVLLNIISSTNLPEAAKAFPNGYLTLLENMLFKIEDMPGQPIAGHWIILLDREDVITHLSVFAPPKSEFANDTLFAWDFLTPDEMIRQFGSDVRPEFVKRQWERM